MDSLPRCLLSSGLRIDNRSVPCTIAARLFLQMRALFEFTSEFCSCCKLSFFTISIEEINVYLSNLTEDFLKLEKLHYEFCKKLSAAERKRNKNNENFLNPIYAYNNFRCPRAPSGLHLPSEVTEELQELAENFLNKAKKYSEQLMAFADTLCSLSEKEILNRIDDYYSKEAVPFIARLQKNCLNELRAKRNAVEHKHDKDGPTQGGLVFRFFDAKTLGNVISPYWYREKDSKLKCKPTDIKFELSSIIFWLLNFSEDVMFLCIREHLGERFWLMRSRIRDNHTISNLNGPLRFEPINSGQSGIDMHKNFWFLEELSESVR